MRKPFKLCYLVIFPLIKISICSPASNFLRGTFKIEFLLLNIKSVMESLLISIGLFLSNSNVSGSSSTNSMSFAIKLPIFLTVILYVRFVFKYAKSLEIDFSHCCYYFHNLLSAVA